jgi:5'-nucleotidase
MHILLTNDDGIFAPGLAAIYTELIKFGEVFVVAPASSRSGASHSITYKGPLACTKVNINGLFSGYSVEGSPADCVKLAVMRLSEKPIDLVVSGINNGANAGINVYYSGTVAAAMEGAFLNIPSVALSLACEEDMDFERSAGICADILGKLMPIEAGSVVNINIPYLSNGEPKGIKIVPQSTGGFDERYILKEDQHGQKVYQLTLGPHRKESPTTDTTSLADGYITITTLAPDMTDHDGIERLVEKFEQL